MPHGVLTPRSRSSSSQPSMIGFTGSNSGLAAGFDRRPYLARHHSLLALFSAPATTPSSVHTFRA